MYETFFGFNDRPFSPSPLVKRYYPSGAAEAARQTLSRCIERGEGIALLLGPAGTGKTLHCQLLAEQFRSRFAVAMLSSGRIGNRRNLYQSILFELRLECRGLDEGELRLALVDYLLNNESTSAGLLLLIDEAHVLPLRVVEELRLLTNLTGGGQSRVRLVIAGGPRLEERLASPKLESFNQRIAARCYLQAFSYDETADYVRSQIAAVGGVPERVLAPDAPTAVHRATDGIPRLINQVCDHALVLAKENGVRQITPAVIEEAWSDLQQLPTPWNSAAGARAVAEPAPDIIEFGALDDVVLAPTNSPVERSITPKLHAAPNSDESVSFDSRLNSRLDFIEATLDSVQRNVELPIVAASRSAANQSAANDPFAELFANEEEVVDRLAKLEANILANRPLVRSTEGRELSSLLERHHKGIERDFMASESRPISGRGQSAGLRPADDPVLPEDSATLSVLSDASLDAASHEDAAAAGGYDDEGYPDLELIVVEDDPSDLPPAPSPPRREGVQQLFTRLHRG